MFKFFTVILPLLDNVWRYCLEKIMATVTKTCIFLMLFGIGHTRACSKSEIYYPGDNVTVNIDVIQKYENDVLEINFCGSTSKLHFTNVMLYETMKSPDENRDFNRNYTGRITNMKRNNGSLSFLLLNVTFTDSGNFTDGKGSCVRAKSTILVTRRRFSAYVDETGILEFIWKSTNTSLIKISRMRFNDCTPLAIYNVSQNNCTFVADDYIGRVQNCELKETTFQLTIPSLNWYDKDTYIAWDDTGLLLDSIFMNIQEKGNTTSDSSQGPIVQYVKSKWFLSSVIGIVVVVLLVAAGLANTAFRKLRQSRANRYGNGSQNIVSTSSAEQNEMISTININSDTLTSFMSSNCPEKVKIKEKKICPGELQCVRSAPISTSKFRIPSNLPLSEEAQSETIKDHDHVYDYADLQNESRSDEPYLRSESESLKGSHPTNSNAGHAAIVQHSYMTLQHIVPDPTVTKEPKKLVSVADSSYGCDKVYTKSLSRVYPSTSYDKVRNVRVGETRCKGFKTELECREFINTLVLPKSFALEDSFASAATNSTNRYKGGQRQQREKVESISSNIFVPTSESFEVRADLKNQSLSPNSNYDLAGHVIDHSSAREKGHRRSQSCGALY